MNNLVIYYTQHYYNILITNKNKLQVKNTKMHTRPFFTLFFFTLTHFLFLQMILTNATFYSRYTFYQLMDSLGIEHMTLVLLYTV